MAVQPRKLTYDEYVLTPDDGRRHELIDGEEYVTPWPNTRHQEVVGLLYHRLYQHLEKHGGGRVFIAPYDVVLSDFDVVEPDLIFVSDAHTKIITEANIRGVPTLLVEVVSDSRMDRRVKRDLYARHGIPEYWVVDPAADWVEVYRLEAGGYGKPEIREPGETLTTELIPGLALDLADLLRR